MSKKLIGFLNWSWKRRLSVLTALAIVAFVSGVFYYWKVTPSAAVLVSADDFPSSLSKDFTPDALIDHISAHLNDITTTADSGPPDELGAQEGLIPQPISQPIIPGTALSSVPSPVFKQNWHGLDLNLARKLGMSFKIRRFVEIEVEVLPGGGWRLLAKVKEAPSYTAQKAGVAPRTGGKCLDLESCAEDLAEQILEVVNYRRLLKYYIKKNTEDSNRRVLELYEKTVPAAGIQPDDLVAWGNAYYALNRYDDALQKYQDALAKDNSYCPARVGRGLVYYYRHHGTEGASDLKRAENNFGSACAENNKFAQANLCSTLIREWRNTAQLNPRSPVLKQAQDHCAMALQIDQRFVRPTVSTGYILYREGHFQEAIKYLDGISQQFPTDSGLLATYGYLLYREYLRQRDPGFLKQAIEKTKQSWDLNNSNGTGNNLGAFHYEQEEYSEAVEFWRKAVLLDGGDPDSRAGLALGLSQTKDSNGAFTSFLLAVKIDTDYCHPELLMAKHDWSDRAAADLAALIKQLPAELNGQIVQNPCAANK
ncbi:MAG TPA: tetratricopeptide repeat protein [Candidatus Angelobacter sp.]